MNNDNEIKLVESQIAYLYNLRQQLNDLVIDNGVVVDEEIYIKTNNVFKSFNENKYVDKNEYMDLIKEYENLVII